MPPEPRHRRRARCAASWTLSESVSENPTSSSPGPIRSRGRLRRPKPPSSLGHPRRTCHRLVIQERQLHSGGASRCGDRHVESVGRTHPGLGQLGLNDALPAPPADAGHLRIGKATRTTRISAVGCGGNTGNSAALLSEPAEFTAERRPSPRSPAADVAHRHEVELPQRDGRPLRQGTDPPARGSDETMRR
jgi:hypothetical protein